MTKLKKIISWFPKGSRQLITQRLNVSQQSLYNLEGKGVRSVRKAMQLAKAIEEIFGEKIDFLDIAEIRK